ncbi:hypothetical protein WJX81_000796 [Elliptochloris bilobata]|uniref:Peptidase M48 domain-containing protein n=1 Tax=Elliptochloris bilobata TaxID=381761 RepID=A0AAW1SCD5_9CHLO
MVFVGIDIPPVLAGVAFHLPNIRFQEKEADITGETLSARACYEPSAAVSVLAKLGEVEKRLGVCIPKFLRTHPLSEERIKCLLQHLPDARHWAELEGVGMKFGGFEAELVPLVAPPALAAVEPGSDESFGW